MTSAKNETLKPVLLSLLVRVVSSRPDFARIIQWSGYGLRSGPYSTRRSMRIALDGNAIALPQWTYNRVVVEVKPRNK
jgi:hypothetical protein